MMTTAQASTYVMRTEQFYSVVGLGAAPKMWSCQSALDSVIFSTVPLPTTLDVFETRCDRMLTLQKCWRAFSMRRW